jgi:DNA-binding LacI/PurR family transcriptional regulator
MNAATMAQIRAAAAELNWVPSSAARAVGGGSAQAIGLVLRREPELLELDPFFPAFLAGVQATLAPLGQSAVTRFVADSGTEREAYRQLAGERRVDGFLIVDLRQRDPRYQWLAELGAPAVVAGSPSRGCPYPHLGTGSDEQVRELLRHLVSKGHRRIAHVTGPAELRHSRRRHQLWEETLHECGIEPASVVTSDFTTLGGVRATNELLDRTPRPTAIFYSNDLMAIAGLSVMAERGVRVPEDIAVAGFDDIGLASYVTPSLTSIYCDYRRMGHTATEMLLAQLRGEQIAQPAVVGAELRLRRSTGDDLTSS